MTTDKIADMLTRINNAYKVKKAMTIVPHSRLLESIAKVLVAEQYLKSYTLEKDEQGFAVMKINLNYIDGEPVLHVLKRVSTPGKRVYRGSSQLGKVLSGLGVSIISTPKGIMTNHEAKKQHLGGEVLCELW